MSVTSSNDTVPVAVTGNGSSTVARTRSKVSDVVLASLEVQFPSIRGFNPVAPGPDDRAHVPPPGKMAVYRRYFEICNFRLPVSAFIVDVCEHFKIALSQLLPLGLMRLLMFEMFCRGHGGEPSVVVLCRHFRIAKQDCWFSFEKRPSSSFTTSKGPPLRSWKDGFFFVDVTCLPRSPAVVLSWNFEGIVANLNAIPRDHGPDLRLFNLCNGAALHMRTYHQEALLFALGVCSSWKHGNARPVFRKNGHGMGALQ